MKTIILATSIFFLLGLKVSNKVDLLKKTGQAPVVTSKIEYPEKPAVGVNHQEGNKPQADIKIQADTSKTSKTSVIKIR